MKSPTQQQLKTIKAVQTAVDDTGLPPTTMELCDALGVTGNAVRQRVEACVKKGLLVRRPNTARGLLLTPEGKALCTNTEA